MIVGGMVLLMEDMRRSPVEVGSLSHYLQGFSTIPGGCLKLQPESYWENGWVDNPMPTCVAEFLRIITLPKTNIAPENRPLEREIPIGKHRLEGRPVGFREGINQLYDWTNLLTTGWFKRWPLDSPVAGSRFAL